MHRKTNSKGFTLVELMLAMSFIAFLLLFLVAAIMQVTRLYVKGSAIRQINQTGRQVVDDIGTAIRSNVLPRYDADHNRLCVGNVTYIWNSEEHTVSTNTFSDSSTPLQFISTQDLGSLCDDPLAPVKKADTVDLIGPEVTPIRLTIDTRGRLTKIDLILSTAGHDNTAVDVGAGKYECRPNDEFCAFGEFVTSVYSRNRK